MRFICSNVRTKKKLLKTLIFLSGFGLLSLQIWQTFQTFIEKRSTFAVSNEISDELLPPTIVLCLPFQENIFLNENLNISIRMSDESRYITIKKELSVGGNHDDQNELMLNVHELTTINMGLCYALEFNKNYKMSKMGIQSVICLRIIAQEEKLSKTKVTVQLVSSAETYEHIFPDPKPSPIPLIVGDSGVNLVIKKLVWKYLPSKRNCKYYNSVEPEEDSYVQCRLKKKWNVL